MADIELEREPCISVSYINLSHSGKRLLETALKEWIQGVVLEKELVSGRLAGSLELSLALTSDSGDFVLIDKPNLSKTLKGNGTNFNAQYEKESNVPLYDRHSDMGLSTAFSLVAGHDCLQLYGLVSANESPAPLAKRQRVRSSRCFNCGSYSHSLNDCPKPRDRESINAARREMAEVREATTKLFVGRSSRYYDAADGDGGSGAMGMDSLKEYMPPRLAEALGITGTQPPPWLPNMAAMGYPPAFLAESAGGLATATNDLGGPVVLKVYDEEEAEAADGAVEAGQGGEERGKKRRSHGGGEAEDGELPDAVAGTNGRNPSQLVEIPGLNAPVPEGADREHWLGMVRRGRGWARQYDEAARQRQAGHRTPSHSSDGPEQCPPHAQDYTHQAMQQQQQQQPTYAQRQQQLQQYQAELAKGLASAMSVSAPAWGHSQPGHGQWQPPGHAAAQQAPVQVAVAEQAAPQYALAQGVGQGQGGQAVLLAAGQVGMAAVGQYTAQAQQGQYNHQVPGQNNHAVQGQYGYQAHGQYTSSLSTPGPMYQAGTPSARGNGSGGAGAAPYELQRQPYTPTQSAAPQPSNGAPPSQYVYTAVQPLAPHQLATTPPPTAYGGATVRSGPGGARLASAGGMWQTPPAGVQPRPYAGWSPSPASASVPNGGHRSLLPPHLQSRYSGPL